MVTACEEFEGPRAKASRGLLAPRALPTRRGVVAAGLLAASASGLAAAGLVAPGTSVSRAPEGPEAAWPRYWAADRDAREVIGLDAQLFVVARAPHDWPVRIAARDDGGAWVVCASGGDPLGAHVLRRIGANALAVSSDVALGPLLDLACHEGGDALAVCIEDSGRTVAVHGADGSVRRAPAGELASCAASRGDELLLGTEGGLLELRDYRELDRVVAARSFGGVIADVAPGPRRRTWWVLDAAGGPNQRRVALLDGDLATLWVRPAGVSALALAPEPRAERVWLVDASAPLARRFGPGGAVEIASAPLSLAGAERALARVGGGALFVAPGALLAIDAQGNPAPGQGGFDFLVELSCRS